MGLQDQVVFPGFVDDMALAALYQSCRAVIYPSLSEGLGLPVIEAIAFEKPVLCARYASLQGVAGEGAVYFDPRLLSDVTQAIELAAYDTCLLQRVARAGQTHRATSGDAPSTAEEYLRLFCEVAA